MAKIAIGSARAERAGVACIIRSAVGRVMCGLDAIARTRARHADRRILDVMRGSSFAAFTVSAAAALVVDVESAHAEEARARLERPMPWDGLGKNSLDAVTGYSPILFAAAVVSTGALAASGADDRVYSYYLAHDFTSPAAHRAFFVAGFIVPVLAPTAVWIAGLVGDNRTLAGSGAGALQAVGVTLFW